MADTDSCLSQNSFFPSSLHTDPNFIQGQNAWLDTNSFTQSVKVMIVHVILCRSMRLKRKPLCEASLLLKVRRVGSISRYALIDVLPSFFLLPETWTWCLEKEQPSCDHEHKDYIGDKQEAERNVCLLCILEWLYQPNLDFLGRQVTYHRKIIQKFLSRAVDKLHSKLR